MKGLKTKPPARYSEATLLGAMESAGKQIDDDELRPPCRRRAWARQPRARPSSKAC
jgi:hypothetical protein